jgi:hypothetical protein
MTGQSPTIRCSSRNGLCPEWNDMSTPQPTMRARIEHAVFTPIAAFQWSYLPPMMVYFAAGAAGLIGVASQFWIKRDLTLTPVALASLAVWAGLPSIMKMVFGEMVDTVKIFGSNRRAYIFIGAALVVCAMLLLAGASSGLLTFASPNTLYVTATLLSAIGMVMQDVAADAMTTEVVARTAADGTPRAKADIDADLTMVQVLGRMFLLTGALSVAYLGGYLAKVLPYSTVFLLGLAVPLISITGALLVKTDSLETRPTDWTILGGGIAFGLGVLILGLLDVPFAQEITFLISLCVIGFMLHRISTEMPVETRLRIFYAALIIFCFRAYPTTGDGYRWFLIDTYKFDELFFGALDTVGLIITLIAAWVLSGFISRSRITSVLLGLTLFSTVMSLPSLILVFQSAMAAVTRATGLGPQSVAILDTAVQSPIVQLSMIPMLSLIAINAPAKSRAIWFALMASFMNVAITAGDLMTKYMNMIFVVERGRYGDLPALALWATAISFVIPVAAILLWRKRVD